MLQYIKTNRCINIYYDVSIDFELYGNDWVLGPMKVLERKCSALICMSNSVVLFKFELLFDIFRYTHYTELDEHNLGIKTRFRIVQITYVIGERLKLKAYFIFFFMQLK